jgi:asparagine synthase (glutamine-hydrolysing)
MPGIAGIIRRDPNAPASASALECMIKSMQHEAFYTSGTYSNPRLGVDAGWVCHRGSFADCLPVWNETRDICLLFAGENFMDAGQAAHLQKNGHQFRADNATALIHLYEEKGIAFLRELNGWFSGLLIDLRQSKVVLFNDRYGLGRVYVHETKEALYFASEAKALLKVLPATRQLNNAAFGQFFSFGCVVGNDTLFSGISLLPGAAQWELAPGRDIRKEVYFAKSEWENQAPLSEEDYYTQLRETFARILPRYLQANETVGVSLTGGLDSRMIMAWANGNKFPCYTFGGIYRDCADVKIARRIAAACRQSFDVIRVDGDFLSQFPALAEKTVHVTDGAMDVSGAVELFVNRQARNFGPIRLTGNYGSEVLRGNVAFKPMKLDHSVFDPAFAGSIRQAAQTYAGIAQDHRSSFVLFKQTPWHHYARLAVEQSQLILRTPYLDNELTRLVYRAPGATAASAGPSMRLVADGNPDLTRFATDRAVSWQPDPLFGRARNLYQQFTVKAEYAYDYGMPQWLTQVDRVLSPLQLERLFLGRHKFYHFRVWYRRQLAGYVRDVLLDRRTLERPYLCADSVRQAVAAHVEGRGNFTLEIHRLLAGELIQRTLIEHN